MREVRLKVNPRRTFGSRDLRHVIERLLDGEVLGKSDALAIQKSAYRAFLRSGEIEESHLDLPLTSATLLAYPAAGGVAQCIQGRDTEVTP